MSEYDEYEEEFDEDFEDDFESDVAEEISFDDDNRTLEFSEDFDYDE